MTQPQPGQYWGVRQIPAVRIIGFDGDECIVRHRDGRLTTLAKGNWQRTDSEWQHLPDCDSFDWVPSQPDPGEGWRLIDKAVDVPQEGDEFWDREHCEWMPRPRAYRDSPFSEISIFYRRRIEPRTRTVVLREWLLWTSPGHECLQWLASDPLGWPHRYPTGQTRTIEVPE
jgi:hypothetical protein